MHIFYDAIHCIQTLYLLSIWVRLKPKNLFVFSLPCSCNRHFHSLSLTLKPKILECITALINDLPCIRLFFSLSYLDHINVMSYDFYGPWSSVLGHNSPLYVRSEDRNDASASLLSQVSALGPVSSILTKASLQTSKRASEHSKLSVTILTWSSGQKSKTVQTPCFLLNSFRFCLRYEKVFNPND